MKAPLTSTIRESCTVRLSPGAGAKSEGTAGVTQESDREELACSATRGESEVRRPGARGLDIPAALLAGQGPHLHTAASSGVSASGAVKVAERRVPPSEDPLRGASVSTTASWAMRSVVNGTQSVPLFDDIDSVASGGRGAKGGTRQTTSFSLSHSA